MVLLSLKGCQDELIGVARQHKVKHLTLTDPDTGKEETQVLFQNPFTDFITPLHPNYVEMAAELIVTQIRKELLPNLENSEKNLFLCSMGVRGAGSLCHSVAQRLGVPYSLSDWYPPGSVGELEVGECIGVGGRGQLFLNGVPEDVGVCIVADRVYGGESILQMIEALHGPDSTRRVMGVVSAMEMVPSTGTPSEAREKLKPLSIPLYSFVEVCCREADYHAGPSSQHTLTDEELQVTSTAASPDTTTTTGPSLPSPSVEALRKLTPEEVKERLDLITPVFIGIPIIYNEKVDYPYCYFSFTDFIPALHPSVVEAMADLCVYDYYENRKSDPGISSRDPLSLCTVMVSEGDRGGAPLLHAVALRLQKPYVIAHWLLTSASTASPIGDRRSSVRSRVTNIGFSGGESQLALNGVVEGDVCLFVDDMLSSGGTAEAIFDCISERGGVVCGGWFASEKLYPTSEDKESSTALTSLHRKGYKRIRLLYPDCDIVTLVQFVVEGTKTKSPPARVEGGEGLS